MSDEKEVYYDPSWTKEEIFKKNMSLVYVSGNKRNIYAEYIADRHDYYQEGFIGLLKAIDTFDPNKGIKFSTYATTCIENSMNKLSRKVDRIRKFYGLSFNDPISDYSDIFDGNITIQDVYNKLQDIDDLFKKATISLDILVHNKIVEETKKIINNSHRSKKVKSILLEMFDILVHDYYNELTLEKVYEKVVENLNIEKNTKSYYSRIYKTLREYCAKAAVKVDNTLDEKELLSRKRYCNY